MCLGFGGFLAAASTGAVVGVGDEALAAEAGARGGAGGVAAGPGSGVMMLTGGVEAAVGNSALVGLPVGIVGARAAVAPAAATAGAFHDGE